MSRCQGNISETPCPNEAEWRNENGVEVCEWHKLTLDAFNWEKHNTRKWTKLNKEMKTMARKFAYDSREFSDPDPTLSIDEVKKSLANFFPEISTADVKEHKQDNGDVVYEFQRKTGTKG